MGNLETNKVFLSPLSTEGVLWIAALDRVPIEERIEWVKKMLVRVEQRGLTINPQAASL